MSPESTPARPPVRDAGPDPDPARRDPATAPGWLQLHGALLAVQLTFSGFHVLGKVVLESIPPLGLAVMRVSFAAPLLLLLAWRRGALWPGRDLLPRLALLGLCGVFLNQVLFVTGLKYTTATNAAILMPSIPAFTVAVGALLGIERIGPRRLLGILLATAGALVLLDPVGFSLTRDTLVGNLLILVNCLSFALFLVLQRPLLERLSPLTVLAWAFLFGGAGVALAGGGALLRLDAAAVPAVAWWGVLYVMLFPTVIGYLLNTWAVGRSSATLVAAYTTAQPLLTGLAAALFLGERLGWHQAAGFALIAAGLWRISWR